MRKRCVKVRYEGQIGRGGGQARRERETQRNAKEEQLITADSLGITEVYEGKTWKEKGKKEEEKEDENRTIKENKDLVAITRHRKLKGIEKRKEREGNKRKGRTNGRRRNRATDILSLSRMLGNYF